MLDVDTRRRIDAARDILVGKVPDPKSQVEQITIALMYKFMDDMDAMSEKLGGRRSFFAGDFARFRWSALVNSGLGGHEMLERYVEAIASMLANPGIPLLFRRMFDKVYLPYNDAETLRLFLTEVDGFDYADSEQLGDAFEYLLSYLGVQGKLGQFRTPRHIIDFIVAIIDPMKDDTILDPACGTAGFLISARKHILAASPDTNGNSSLTPDELGRLASNLIGYDIDPGMVRLSLVNMYLHGANDPRIQEYDTLTQETNWNQYADIIIANPPFMNPKGGIRPHKRFSLKSNQSAVLFVDYMVEHLMPDGRAGIIVPESIIANRTNVHTQLRKMLVDKCLVAVISLPAGVFNPYTNSKTAILILDKVLASESETIGFFKIDNDGRDLGAQRRPIESNDLPAVQASVIEYLRRLRTAETLEGYEPTLGIVVDKSQITSVNGYHLNGERYRERPAQNSPWPMARLGDIAELVRGVTYTKDDEVTTGGHQVLRANNINLQTSLVDLSDVKNISTEVPLEKSKRLQAGDVFICLASGSKDHVGKVAYIRNDMDFYFGGFMGAIRVTDDRLLPGYLFNVLRQPHFNSFLRSQIAGINIRNLSASILYEFQIPLPPLEVQAMIVAEIEEYQDSISSARAEIERMESQISATVDRVWGDRE